MYHFTSDNQYLYSSYTTLRAKSSFLDGVEGKTHIKYTSGPSIRWAVLSELGFEQSQCVVIGINDVPGARPVSWWWGMDRDIWSGSSDHEGRSRRRVYVGAPSSRAGLTTFASYSFGSYLSRCRIVNGWPGVTRIFIWCRHFQVIMATSVRIAWDFMSRNLMKYHTRR